MFRPILLECNVTFSHELQEMMAVYFDVTQYWWFSVCQFVNIKIAHICS